MKLKNRESDKLTNKNKWCIIPMLMRSWRNWQTRKTKDLVGNSMQVQFLSTAPKSGNYAKTMHKCPIFFVYLTCLCGQKNDFLIKTLVFGVHFGVHILISFPLMTKALRAFLSKSFLLYEIKIQTVPNPFGSS